MSNHLCNPAYTERWTCPACYCDHDRMVTECDSCGAKLRCTIEQDPVPYCYLVDGDEEADAE